MAGRFYSILFFPGDSARVKKLKLSRRAALGGLVGLVIFLLLSSLSLIQYASLRVKAYEARYFKKVARIQKAEIERFASKVNSLEKELSRLRELEGRLRVMLNLDKPSGGMGSIQPQEIRPDALSLEAELERLEEELDLRKKNLSTLEEALRSQRRMLAYIPSIMPAEGWISSDFGPRISPFTGREQMHEGIDISNNIGTPVIAPANGRVTFAGYDGASGKLLTIDHGYGIVTRYGHLKDILVARGQMVRRGDKVATMGNSGLATGPHLHYEVLAKGVPVDPKRYILD